MVGPTLNVDEHPSIAGWCATAGGPHLCDSNPIVNAACAVRSLALVAVKGQLCEEGESIKV